MAAAQPYEPIRTDRQRFGRILVIAGSIGVLGALVAGVAGWILAGRATRTVTETLEPISGIVVNLSETVDASLVMVDRTTTAIESIESATRSTGRTLDSVSQVIGDTAAIVEGSVAESLDSAVDTLPALVDTGRVIDGTMRTLSLVGVDYDPEVPLDESIAQLERSLRPLPEQLRDQVTLLTEVQDDVEQIALDAESLASVMLQARLDLTAVEEVLESASENAATAARRVEEIRSDVDTYDTLARIVVVALTVALLAAASAPLIIGFHYRGVEEEI